jgi:phosphatidylinositol glycan class M
MFFVFLTYYLLLKANGSLFYYILAGLVYGLSVHLKIFPIIYCMTFYFTVDSNGSAKSFCDRIFKNFFTTNRIAFTVATVAAIVACTAVSYHLYGEEYLEHALIYHFKRKDHRHNFSVYWYLMYLNYD